MANLQVIDRLGVVHKNYAGSQVLGRCGAVDLSRSAVILKKYPGGWFPNLLGHFFDEGSWDSSDLFMHATDAKGRVSAHIFVTVKER